MIKVIQPGLQTTVQDIGRIGYYEVGMPPSGAMDKYALKVSNLLVGNDENAAGLEITYMGPKLKFEKDTIIAVTGGEIPPKINDEPIGMWETIAVNAGDVLSFDFVKGGVRAYLAVQGGIDVPTIMGSRSTYTLIGLGGLDGRALQENDVLEVGSEKNVDVAPGNKIDDELVPKYSKDHEIRVVMGLCSYRLTDESKEKFLNIEWKVTPDANRVGYRFRGEKMDFVDREQPFGAGSDPSNVTDLGYPIGSIQIPGGVEPIALLNDAVTGGGYVTVATIISTDLDKMAQVKSGEKVKFVSVDIEESLNARKEVKNKLDKIRKQLS